jgi:hypothetical protein
MDSSYFTLLLPYVLYTKSPFWVRFTRDSLKDTPYDHHPVHNIPPILSTFLSQQETNAQYSVSSAYNNYIVLLP